MSSTAGIKSLPKVFKQSSCGKQLQCLVCDCWLPSTAEKFVESHLTGRKHKQQLQKKEKKEHVLKCSVYVKGFDPHTDKLEDELKSYFEALHAIVKEIYVDKNKASYAIVEFNDEECVDIVMNSGRSKFHGMKLVIRRREESKQKPDLSTEQEGGSAANSLVTGNCCLLPKELEEILSVSKELSTQMEYLKNYFILTKSDLELRSLLCELLQSVLEEIHPNCQVKLFGSSANGLGVEGCDVDITLLTVVEASNENEVMSEVREVIQRFAPGCKNVSIIESAKNCSIVKFLHTESKLNVDLSLNNRLALKNTKLIEAYIKCDPRVLLLLHTVRTWAKYNNLSGKTTLQVTNYALTLMTIYYMQQMSPPVIPCLQGVDSLLEANYIGPWNCAFMQDSFFESKNTSTTGELLHGFFEFYLNFQYSLHGIAIHSVKPMTIENCRHNAYDVDQDNDLNIGTAVVVQDPFKLSHNVAQNLSPEGLTVFLNKLKQAAEITAPTQVTNPSLIQLFIQKKVTKTRTKQKHKRNRSNIYSISLPNCNHVSKESSLCCYDYAKTLLHDLQMKVTGGNEPSSDQHVAFTVGTRSDVVPKSETDECNVHLQSSGMNVNKRKHCEDEHEDTNAKKLKMDTNLEFTVCASTDTWTNRRKQRRHQTATISSEIDTKTEHDLASLDNPDMITVQTSAAIENKNINASTIANDTEKELFQFKVSILQAVDKKDICKLTLEPIDCVKNLQQFQTFYAYFKKQLITVFK